MATATFAARDLFASWRTAAHPRRSTNSRVSVRSDQTGAWLPTPKLAKKMDPRGVIAVERQGPRKLIKLLPFVPWLQAWCGALAFMTYCHFCHEWRSPVSLCCPPHCRRISNLVDRVLKFAKWPSRGKNEQCGGSCSRSVCCLSFTVPTGILAGFA